ncbi:hypothetical protein CLOM_g18924 [Closterium sp. NIES-68]|nr:hypothetical protein CLOM_g18924 [Closterium sp. NIES-68]
MGTGSVLAKSALKWLAIAATVALASVATFHAVDNFYVIRHPPVCATSSTRDVCVSEYRVARRSLGAVPASSQQVTAAMIESARAKVAAGLALVQEIRTANGGQNAQVDAVSDDCSSQVSAALAQLEKSSAAIGGGSNVLDLPYWLQTAQTQLANCLAGYREMAPSALSTPTGVYLEAETTKTKSTLVAAIDLTSQAAASARASRGRQALENGAEGGHPEWLEAGLYEQLKELQAHMQGTTTARRDGRGSAADCSVSPRPRRSTGGSWRADTPPALADTQISGRTGGRRAGVRAGGRMAGGRKADIPPAWVGTSSSGKTGRSAGGTTPRALAGTRICGGMGRRSTTPRASGITRGRGGTARVTAAEAAAAGATAAAAAVE